MPIYEYECNACGERHEFIQKFSEGPKRKCPSCGKSRLKKLMSAAAFHLKGSGWYVTDFRDKNKKSDGDSSTADGAPKASSGDDKADSSKSETKSESKSDSGSDSKSSDSKKSDAKKSDSKKKGTKAA